MDRFFRDRYGHGSKDAVFPVYIRYNRAQFLCVYRIVEQVKSVCLPVIVDPCEIQVFLKSEIGQWSPDVDGPPDNETSDVLCIMHHVVFHPDP